MQIIQILKPVNQDSKGLQSKYSFLLDSMNGIDFVSEINDLKYYNCK